jgi:hypothetical protein
VFCFFESSDGRFTRDGRKSLQKVFECFSALQVVEQRLVDGKVTIYGGKKKSGTMKRALDLLAELPKDAAQKERKKDKPQKRKRL